MVTTGRPSRRAPGRGADRRVVVGGVGTTRCPRCPGRRGSRGWRPPEPARPSRGPRRRRTWRSPSPIQAPTRRPRPRRRPTHDGAGDAMARGSSAGADRGERGGGVERNRAGGARKRPRARTEGSAQEGPRRWSRSRSVVPMPFHAMITTSAGASPPRPRPRRWPHRSDLGVRPPEPRDLLEGRRDRVQSALGRQVARSNAGTEEHDRHPGVGQAGDAVLSSDPGRAPSPHAGPASRRHRAPRWPPSRRGSVLRGTRPRPRDADPGGGGRTAPRPVHPPHSRRSCSHAEDAEDHRWSSHERQHEQQ